MTHTTKDYPRGTPIFGKCFWCSDVLPYPPIQIPVSVVHGTNPGAYDIVWRHACLSCAPNQIKKLKEEDLIPVECWAPGKIVTITNPYRRGA